MNCTCAILIPKAWQITLLLKSFPPQISELSQKKPSRMMQFIFECNIFFNTHLSENARLFYHKFKQQQKPQTQSNPAVSSLTEVDVTHKRHSFLKRHLSRGKC